MKDKQTRMPELQLKYKAGSVEKVRIDSAAAAYQVFKNVYDVDTIEYCESCIVLFLNQGNVTIGWLKLSQGGITGTVVDAKILFATALQCGASAVIVSHNHPSGTLKPSEQDKQLTRRLKAIGELLEIPLLDHLIVTTHDYYSFSSEGTL